MERDTTLSELKSWFAEAELEACSACGARAVPVGSDVRVCLECGQTRAAGDALAP